MDSSTVLRGQAGVWVFGSFVLFVFTLFMSFTDCYTEDAPLWCLEGKVMGC